VIGVVEDDGVGGIVVVPAVVIVVVVVVVVTSTHAMIPTVTPVGGDPPVVDVMLIITIVPAGT
jgi:hypothetical protein